MRKLKINRINNNDIQSLGCMSVVENDKVLKVFNSLELPYKDNQRRISCIPCGTYTVKIRHSDKFGKHFHILDVPNRDYILIHAGNFHTDILGCILIGKSLTALNNDSYLDVISSRTAMKELIELMPLEFKLTII